MKYKIINGNIRIISMGYLPLNDPVIALIQRITDKKDIDEIVVCKISLRSSNVGPIIGPHKPLKRIHSISFL